MITLELLDRTLFEHLRLIAVGANLLPNWRTISGATTEDKQVNYEAAKAALSERLEVYSLGSGESKNSVDISKHSRINISRKSVGLGSIGASGVTGYNKNGNVFDKFIYPDRSSNLVYEVRLFTNKTSIERVVQNGILDRVGNQRMIQCIDENWEFTGDYFMIEYTGMVNVSSTDIVEMLYTFSIKDVWLAQPRIIKTGIAPMTTIYISTYLGDLTRNPQKLSESLVEEITVA